MEHFNFIIENEHLRADDAASLGMIAGQSSVGTDTVECLPADTTLTVVDLLVACKFFASKSQARKAGWRPELPTGFSTWSIGKKKRSLTIWNPTS